MDEWQFVIELAKQGGAFGAVAAIFLYKAGRILFSHELRLRAIEDKLKIKVNPVG